MKKYIFPLIITTCAAGLIWSCSKKIDLVAPTASINGLAYIKVAQLSPNFRAVVGGRDSFNVYMNEKKVNGAFLTYGSFFPTTTNLYAAVTPGQQVIRMTVNGTNTPDSVNLVGFTKNLVAGNYYSFLLTDSLISLDPTMQMFIQDNFIRTDTLHYTIRLVHAITNDSAGKNIDVYSTRLGTNIFSNISPGTATSFIVNPYTITADTFIVRRTGNPFELCRLSTVALPIARERAYTLVYKGLRNTSTGTKGRSLIYYADQ
jgi:hypothetical protein